MMPSLSTPTIRSNEPRANIWSTWRRKGSSRSPRAQPRSVLRTITSPERGAIGEAMQRAQTHLPRGTVVAVWHQDVDGCAGCRSTPGTGRQASDSWRSPRTVRRQRSVDREKRRRPAAPPCVARWPEPRASCPSDRARSRSRCARPRRLPRQPRSGREARQRRTRCRGVDGLLAPSQARPNLSRATTARAWSAPSLHLLR